MLRRRIWILAAGLLLTTAVPALADGPDTRMDMTETYHQTNLVSDLPGMAQTTDPHLINPWGIATSPTSPFWISDNNAGVSTLYNTSGQKLGLEVTIPPPGGSPAGTMATPTGTVFNPTNDFVVTAPGKSDKAAFIFATEDGTISGWSPNVDATNAILTVDNQNTDSGPVYKGLALASSGGQNYLYATNFRFATIDVFDAMFKPVHLAGSFSDPGLPAGFAPFGIQAVGNRLIVTYAMQNAEKHDDVAGPGNGFVDIFTTNGMLVRRFASRGALNSPWGVAVAPDHFGRFKNDVLIGNFGDGRINAFDENGHFRGQLQNEQQQPITIDGLWGLRVGNGGNGGDANTLYFTAGIDGEQHGLFGSIAPATGD